MFNNNEKFEVQKIYLVSRQETKVNERYIELHINKLYHVINKLIVIIIPCCCTENHTAVYI